MKPSLQLRFGQQLTMTPQLQQAIRLLQLSTLDLRQEIQDALDSNMMLEAEEEAGNEVSLDDELRPDISSNDANNETEVNLETESMPDEMATDSQWEDIYDSLPTQTASTASADDHAEFIAQQSADLSLHAHLSWQLEMCRLSESDHEIGEAIIDSVNDDGYLTASIEELIESVQPHEVEEDEVIAVLHQIQQFDPPGIAARDTRESLLIQTQQLSNEFDSRELALQLLEHHFDDLAGQNIKAIMKGLSIGEEELNEVLLLIRSLNPRPASALPTGSPDYIEPDVYVFKHEGKWFVTLNDEAMPKLKINATYASLIRRADDSSDNVTLKNHLQEARWFINSLLSRNETLLKVANCILEFQQGFFDHGEEAMRPLVLRDVAEKVEMHESTISRVTTQKYMHTPRGTFEFKYFFSSHVSTAEGGEASSTAIRALIKKLIAAETPKKPLSDNKIAAILDDQGIKVARRTVAKYREAMAIPPSNERKRLA